MAQLDTSGDFTQVFCICLQPETEDKEMIGCDNPQCEGQWFHLECLNITMEDVPDGEWYCPDCLTNSGKGLWFCHK